VAIALIPANAPQQRPRATGVTCKHNGLAGSAGCGGWTMPGYSFSRWSTGPLQLGYHLIDFLLLDLDFEEVRQMTDILEN
jgi:hypothetical protein